MERDVMSGMVFFGSLAFFFLFAIWYAYLVGLFSKDCKSE